MPLPATESRMRVAMDTAIVVAVAVIAKAVFYQIAWKFAGPISLLCAVSVATYLIRRRGLGWRDFGLAPLTSRKSYLLLLPQAALVFVGIAIIVIFAAIVVEPFIHRIETTNDRFEGIAGNFPYFLLWISIAVIHGGFFEEMIYRGFIITSLLHVFRGIAFAPYVAVILPAIFFGFRHYYYQGAFGAIQTALIGITFGFLFLAFKRNLWPLVLAHASLGVLRFISDYTS